MKIISLNILFSFFLVVFVKAGDEPININFNNLKVEELIRITSKVVNKNILVTQKIEGNVDFISNKKIFKEELLDILTYVLESKGFMLLHSDDILRIVKIKDFKKPQENCTEIMAIKNADAKNILNIVNSIIEKSKSKLSVSIDENSNLMILIGPKDEVDSLKSVIYELDKDKAQVYVQARIIEVSERKTNDIGIRYGLAGFSTGNSSLLTFSSALNSVNGVPNINLTGLDTFGLDLDRIKDGLSLGASINLLKQNFAADIVSEPSILCINNKESKIYVGNTVSIKTGSTTTEGGLSKEMFKRENIGLSLKVKPRIASSDKVILEIKATLEDISQSMTNGQPDTSKKEVLTSAIVNNGESVILGGLVKSKLDTRVDKLPILGDMPLVGTLFRNNSDVHDKINLVVVITPYIVPSGKDMSYIRNKLSNLKTIEDKYTKELQLKLKQRETDTKQKKVNSYSDMKPINES